MIKIKTNNNDIVLFTNSCSISFKLSQSHIFTVIKKNIEYINKEGCNIVFEKIKSNKSYIILNGMKLMIPELAAYEISSRMQLLNSEKKLPSDNVIESS